MLDKDDFYQVAYDYIDSLQKLRRIAIFKYNSIKLEEKRWNKMADQVIQSAILTQSRGPAKNPFLAIKDGSEISKIKEAQIKRWVAFSVAYLFRDKNHGEEETNRRIQRVTTHAFERYKRGNTKFKSIKPELKSEIEDTLPTEEAKRQGPLTNPVFLEDTLQPQATLLTKNSILKIKRKQPKEKTLEEFSDILSEQKTNSKRTINSKDKNEEEDKQLIPEPIDTPEPIDIQEEEIENFGSHKIQVLDTRLAEDEYDLDILEMEYKIKHYYPEPKSKSKSIENERNVDDKIFDIMNFKTLKKLTAVENQNGNYTETESDYEGEEIKQSEQIKIEDNMVNFKILIFQVFQS